MASTLRICLKAGDRIYINGALLRADRKVTIEILNDVTFLLEQHVLPQEEATTPLRRLYFALQTILTEPAHANLARRASEELLSELIARCPSPDMDARLSGVAASLAAGRVLDGLKAIRAMFEEEESRAALPRTA